MQTNIQLDTKRQKQEDYKAKVNRINLWALKIITKTKPFYGNYLDSKALRHTRGGTEKARISRLVLSL